MNESVPTENKQQICPKAPVSRARIAGEILAGAAVGLAVGLPAAWGFLMVAPGGGGCFEGLGALGVSLFFVLPITYGPASAVGVYLVGNRDAQTGSLGLTLGYGLLGGLGTSALTTFGYVLSFVLGSVVGVCLVGKRRRQAGSFFLTLCGGLGGGLVMAFLSFLLSAALIFLPQVAAPVVLLIPPITATWGFNRTRRDK